ncbi:multicopper oxidase family protein [Gordonia sp. CPCC 205515]|uniref:multicopper oxidase family protein n=1 Tax=Gordonia sp. CPCC 205515 TaxID=3140791 RepID=UPI003AF34E86
MKETSRRQVLLGGLGLVGAGVLASCGFTSGGSSTRSAATSFGVPSPVDAAPGRRVVEASLSAQEMTVDLGSGITARTWAYGDLVPGKVLRATAGDVIRARVTNRLPADTTIHWHGVHLRNSADGVPGVTQDPIASGDTYVYEFTAPNAGTHFFHPHVGVQIDRGLYAPLIIDDPNERGDFDDEWIVVLDDWTDGVGQNPDAILADYKAQNGSLSSMGGMGGMGGMGTAMPGMGGASKSVLGDAGDVNYPYYLINGRVPAAPTSFTSKPGHRIRIRMINAGADTVFKVALGGHPMTVTHSDGFPVVPRTTGSLYIAMGERYDVIVTAGDGVFPLVANAEGKTGQALALLRTGSGTAPSATAHPTELDSTGLLGSQDLTATESARLPTRQPDGTLDVTLNGQMKPYGWGINGKKYGEDTPMTVHADQRVRMRMTNMTAMVHPMHIHGHSWGLPASGGLRKDTVLVRPMQTIVADLQADNPGDWAFHCHNIYHAEVGMMTTVKYA